MQLQILYEDNHLIAVYKPAGVLVQGDQTGDPTLIDEVKYYLKTKYHKLGKVFLGVVHRLDRPVSGIILFAKTSKGAARISEQIRKHEVKKIYHALVVGKPKKTRANLVHYLKKNAAINRVDVFQEPVEGSLRAEMDYELVLTNEIYSIIKIVLKTGRSHQIRAQLAAIDHPIVGDVKYGAPSPLLDRSLALCATSLRFKLATKDEEKEIHIDVPQNWKKFINSVPMT